MSLPAGPMTSLTAALDGICTIWCADGSERQVSAVNFVTGDQCNVLLPGELLRSIAIPLAALRRRSAFRQISLTPVGRSAVLMIGARQDGGLLLTVTASTRRPAQLAFASWPDADALRQAILAQIPDDLYHDDLHGKPAWRKAMTLRLADEIRGELQDGRP
jgi:CO/xanthine dehydrogenase FAD-binding subunit